MGGKAYVAAIGVAVTAEQLAIENRDKQWIKAVGDALGGFHPLGPDDVKRSVDAFIEQLKQYENL